MVNIISVFTAVVAAASVVVAAPGPTGEFYLRTTALQGKFGDMYVQAYHTGAGTAHAVLTASKADAPKGWYFNATSLQLDIGNPTFSFGVMVGIDNDYSAWEPVLLEGGTGTKPMVADELKGITWESPLMGGWLVCPWSHGVPQLFWLYAPYSKFAIPSSCGKVTLWQQFA